LATVPRAADTFNTPQIRVEAGLRVGQRREAAAY
jgi:hypothetical protein